jgi:hypothetical protein
VSRYRLLTALVLLNILGGMGVAYATRRVTEQPVKRVMTHQQRLASRPGKVRFAIMDDHVRDTLIAAWDKMTKSDTTLLEYGFCLKWQYDIWAGEKAYRATQISRPTNMVSNWIGTSYTCPKGDRVAEVHIHPPQTCADEEGTDCWRGGPYAYQCLPSDQDQRYLLYSGQAFGFVQCSREGIVAYFPPEITHPTVMFVPNAPSEP